MSDLNAKYLLRQAAWGRTITDAEIDELGLPEHVENVLVRFINSTTAVLAAGGLDSRRVAQEIAEEGAEVIAGQVQAETCVEPRTSVNLAEDPDSERWPTRCAGGHVAGDSAGCVAAAIDHPRPPPYRGLGDYSDASRWISYA